MPSANISWIPVTGPRQKTSIDQHSPCQHAHEPSDYVDGISTVSLVNGGLVGCLTKRGSIPRVTFSVSTICLRCQTASCGDINIPKATPTDANKRDAGGLDGPMIDGSRMKSRDKMITIKTSVMMATSHRYNCIRPPCGPGLCDNFRLLLPFQASSCRN